jgi:hypothetical protein
VFEISSSQNSGHLKKKLKDYKNEKEPTSTVFVYGWIIYNVI